MLRIKGDKDAPVRRTLGNIGFFLPWSVVFYVLPSIAFMFMENWTFTEGVYYSFITLTTIGLGDYIAGNIFFIVFFYKDPIIIHMVNIFRSNLRKSFGIFCIFLNYC